MAHQALEVDVERFPNEETADVACISRSVRGGWMTYDHESS